MRKSDFSFSIYLSSFPIYLTVHSFIYSSLSRHLTRVNHFSTFNLQPESKKNSQFFHNQLNSQALHNVFRIFQWSLK